MSAYRYLIFPRGRQPTVGEMEQLRRSADQHALRHAVGVTRDDGRLALAFEPTAFDAALARDRTFQSLLESWQAHGCELVDHLAFVKDSTALRPIARGAPPNPATARGAEKSADDTPLPRDDAARTEGALASKQLAARESLGRSELAVHASLQRIDALNRFAAAVPYLLMALTVVGMLAAGLYISSRLRAARPEERRATIERAIAEPITPAPEAPESPHPQ